MAEADATVDARYGDALAAPTPRTMAMRAERRARLARARDRLTAEDQARCDTQRATKDGWDTAAAAGVRRGRRPADDPPRPNRNNTDPRVNITDPDVRIIRNQKGYVAGDNGQLVVTEQQVIVAVDAQSAPGRRHAATPAAGQLS